MAVSYTHLDVYKRQLVYLGGCLRAVGIGRWHPGNIFSCLLYTSVKEIAPRQVLIYTIDRETPDHDLQKATHEELDRIAERIRETGIPVSVSY